MPVVEETAVIRRPAREVFDFLAVAENLPRWDSSMIECFQLDDGPVGVGTRYRGASSIMGRRMDWTTEVVEFDPARRSASRSIAGDLTFTVSYDITETGDGAELRYRLAAESGLGGAFGRALDPIVERAQQKVVRANLVTLTGLLEQR